MKLKKISNNLQILMIGDLKVWFSYETPIAYKKRPTSNIIICENVWSRTTGRHIGVIKKADENFLQVPVRNFEEKIREISSAYEQTAMVG